MSDKPLSSRLKHAWNILKDDDYTLYNFSNDYGITSSVRQDRVRLKPSNERSIISSVYNRIAIDVASVPIKHVRVDQNGVFKEVINSSLNNCLTLEANIDQTGREFIFDVVMSMFDEGVVALVPIDTSVNIRDNTTFDILSIRTGKIVSWRPRSIRCEVYDDRTGNKKEVELPKEKVGIVENPLYAVMNEPNSTLRRLIHKLNLLDAIDEQSGSSKLDLIIQLPYVVKSETRLKQAEDRRRALEEQLTNSKYGVGYVDSTERITQLNRPVENNLMSQIEYLTSMLYSQLGMTSSIFDGTADEKTMLNYHNRTLEPILSAIVDEIKRKFLTKTARSQNQTIAFYRDPFKLVPVTELASIADTFTRNEILSSNELRSMIGYKPSDDPRANELRNKNLNISNEQLSNPVMVNEDYDEDEYNEDESYEYY